MPHGPPPPPAEDDLAELARRALGIDAAAKRRLLTAIAPPVLRVVRQILGRGHPDEDDIVQEALLGTLAGLARFRGESTVRHFARRVALLTALNARRRHALRERIAPSTPLDEASTFAASSPTPAEALDAGRRRESFLRLLDELPPAQAEALALHCVLGHTLEETAELSGVPANTVRSRLGSAKASLRERIENDLSLHELLRGAS